MNKKPRCFVAMAFGHDDTDAIYDHHIRPVLKRNEVIPSIINRRQDNRDLNIQIIEQLQKCDFCITDLTYARPSVYFEAGFAEREVPVIYTVRSDHLDRKQPEDLRVHFDLQMKPLITWSGTDDSTFCTRLERRLRNTILGNYARTAKIAKKCKAERDKFSSLALNDRFAVILRAGLRALRPVGFLNWSRGWSIREPYYKDPSRFADKYRRFEAHRIYRGRYQIAAIAVTESATKSYLENYFQSFISNLRETSRLRQLTTRNLHRVDSLDEHHMVVALKATPDERVMSSFPWVHRRDLPGHFFEHFSIDLRVGERSKRVDHHVNFLFPPPPLSLPEFRSSCKQFAEEASAHKLQVDAP